MRRGSSPGGSRTAAFAVLLAAVVVLAVVLTRSDPYDVTARFTDGGQLVKGDQVRLGDVSVGSIRKISLAQDGQVDIRLRLHGAAVPLPRGTIARVRLDSLSGVANRYISLEEPLGQARVVPDGGVLSTAQTQTPVDLDELFNTFDAPTRRGLRSFIRGGAQQYGGRADAARVTLDRLSPALEGISGLTDQFTKDRIGFNDLLRQGAVAVHALNTRRGAITDLVDKAQITTQALADEQGALGDALRRLPGVLTHGTRTFATLRATLDPLTTLVDASKPSAPRLPAFFAQLDALVRSGAGPLTRLAATVRRSGANNDLVGLLADAPRLEALTRVAFPRAVRAMNRSELDLADLRAYTPDLIGALSHLGQITANYDANGHYARVQPNLLALALDASSNTLVSAPAGDAVGRLQTKRGARCPGATIPLAPGDTATTVEGCDANARVSR